MPKPRVVKQGDRYKLNYNYPRLIGQVKGFYGNFGVMLRAFTYISTLGYEG